MITKEEILQPAKHEALRPTTIEKDYVIGWLLYGIAQHPRLSHWAFKGGTCLKKCFFETYRFSEDLDFTVPKKERLDADSILSDLAAVVGWVEGKTGIQFPRDRITVEEYVNKRGRTSYQAKVAFNGPLGLPRRSIQRVKFDLTQDEVIVEPTDQRPVFHPYLDAIEPAPSSNCYSVNEVLAEKGRALFEREGRARDVYDLVHLSRSFRDAIDPVKARAIAEQKFAFKGLPAPTPELMLARVDAEVLRANWNDQLAHQLPILPSVDSFYAELPEALNWWLNPDGGANPLPALSTRPDERKVPRQDFPAGFSGKKRSARWHRSGQSIKALNRIRYGARNRLCVEVIYGGVKRLVEPYSLRSRATGNIWLYVFERTRGGRLSDSIMSMNTSKIEAAVVTSIPFVPKYRVEL